MTKAIRAALALGLTPLCVNCASNKPVIRFITPPSERLVCADDPAVPEKLTDATVSGYIVDLHGAYGSCKSAVAWLRDWSNSLGK